MFIAIEILLIIFLLLAIFVLGRHIYAQLNYPKFKFRFPHLKSKWDYALISIIIISIISLISIIGYASSIETYPSIRTPGWQDIQLWEIFP